MASDLTFGIRVTADGQAAIVETRRLREGLDDIGEGAKKTTSALTVMSGALGALQLDRLISGAISAAREMVSFAASLDDLSDVTGSTVENLSGLANQAKVSGVSFSTVEQALTQFSRRLSAADDDSKRMGAALRLLGVEARDPALALNEVAQKFAQYADGANKVALAQEIFGREGARLLPLLKDLANEQEAGTRITRQHAEEAERLEKAWNRLGVSAGGLMQAMTGQVIPVLNDLIERWRLVIQGTNGFWEALSVGRLVASNGGGGVGIAGAIDEVEKDIARVNARIKEAHPFEDWTRELEKLERQLRVLLSLRRQAGGDDFGAPVLPSTLQAPTVPGRQGAARAERVSQEARERVAELKRQAEAELAASRAKQKAIDDEAKALDRLDAAYLKALESEGKRLERQSESIDAYERETDALGKTAQEVEALTIKRLEERKAQLLGMEGAEAHIKLLEREIEARKRRIAALNDQDAAKAETEARNTAAKAAAAAEEEWRRTADSIGNTITEALMRGFESGKDAAKNLRDSLYNMFRTLVLRPIIQAVVAPMAGAATSLFGGSAAAQGVPGFGGSAMQGAGMLGNLFGGGGIGGSVLSSLGMTAGGVLGVPGGTLGSFAVGGIGESLGLSAALGAGEGMALTAAGTAFTAFAAAVPYIGAALAIATALGAFKRGGPKTGGFAGDEGAFGERFFTPNQRDSSMGGLASSTNKAITETLRAFGASGNFRSAFGFDADPEGDAGSRVRAGLTLDGRVIRNTGNIDVGRDEGAVEAALELETKRTLLAALQASDLPQQIGRVLKSVGVDSATASQIDTVVQFGSAMKIALEGAKPGVGAEAAKAYDAQTQAVTTRLRTMGTELQRLAREQDGSVGKMQALAQATAQYRESVAQTLVALRSIGAALTSLFAQTRETIEFAGLDNQGAYDLARSRGNALLAQIEATDDPAVVQRLAERANNYFLQAFNLLSPEEQLSRKPDFLAGLTVLDNAVDSALRRIGATIEGDTTDPFAAVNDALETATVKFDGAATKQQDAASEMREAVAQFGGYVQELKQMSLAPPVPAFPRSEVGP